jgi:hypothetical protein
MLEEQRLLRILRLRKGYKEMSTHLQCLKKVDREQVSVILMDLITWVQVHV